MSKFLIGSYILNKFKSKLEINATNTNITILDDSGKTITPGENALVPNCVYQIIAEPISSDYELSLLQVNGEDTGSGKYFEVGVGENITIQAISEGEPAHIHTEIEVLGYDTSCMGPGLTNGIKCETCGE